MSYHFAPLILIVSDSVHNAYKSAPLLAPLQCPDSQPDAPTGAATAPTARVGTTDGVKVLGITRRHRPTYRRRVVAVYSTVSLRHAESAQLPTATIVVDPRMP